jgi:hypothetical protein
MALDKVQTIVTVTFLVSFFVKAKGNELKVRCRLTLLDAGFLRYCQGLSYGPLKIPELKFPKHISS